MHSEVDMSWNFSFLIRALIFFSFRSWDVAQWWRAFLEYARAQVYFLAVYIF